MCINGGTCLPGVASSRNLSERSGGRCGPGLSADWMTGCYSLRSIQNIKQLAINGDKVVALSRTGDIFVLPATNVQPVSSPSGFKFWDAGDKGGAVRLEPRHALTRGEKSVLLPLHVSEL